ncbi:MAG: HPF/RaiA family ribosome-associated protein [Saprospiraceae bacterium]
MLTRIQSIHFDADTKLIQTIEGKIGQLAHYGSKLKLDAADVILRLENTRAIRTKIVEINLNIPGKPVRVTASGKAFEESFNKAFTQLKRQLIRQKEIIQDKH